MNCCLQSEMQLTEEDQRQQDCSCHGPSRPVSSRTMFLMLKPQVFDKMDGSQYRFCSSPDCPVVYFSKDRSFTTQDLRVSVGVKEKNGPIILCYCFGFYQHDLQNELETLGHTTVPERISALIKAGMCACEERNPSGACCLGEVMKAVKLLKEESQ